MADLKVYLSGPIAGRPDHNREAFEKLATIVCEGGHEPVSPLDVDHAHDGPCWGKDTGRPGDPHRYGCYLMADLVAMSGCDEVLLMADWETSPGAMAEAAVARAAGIPVRVAGG